jgi:hypothetical protein
MIGRQMGTEMADIYVGPSKEHFRVYKDILCKKVEYFDKMFNSGFAEAATNSATFPDDDAESFDILLGWVYHGTLRDLLCIKHEDGAKQCSWQEVNAYALAEKLCVPELQDAVMNAVIKVSKESDSLPSVANMQKAYEKTSQNSPLRNFMAHVFSYTIAKCCEEYWPISSMQPLLKSNDDLSMDFLTLLRKGVPATDPKSLSPCKFHCHDVDEPCVTDSKSTDKRGRLRIRKTCIEEAKEQ